MTAARRISLHVNTTHLRQAFENASSVNIVYYEIILPYEQLEKLDSGQKATTTVNYDKVGKEEELSEEQRHRRTICGMMWD